MSCIQEGKLYQVPENELNEKILCKLQDLQYIKNGGFPAWSEKACILCLGILQDFTLDPQEKLPRKSITLAKKIVEGFKETGHMPSIPKFKFFLPLAIHLREAAFSWHLKSDNCDAAATAAFLSCTSSEKRAEDLGQARAWKEEGILALDVKAVLKRAVLAPVAAELGVANCPGALDNEGDLEIHVSFDAVAADVEAADMVFPGENIILPHEGAGGRKGLRRDRRKTEVTWQNMRARLAQVQDPEKQKTMSALLLHKQLCSKRAALDVKFERQPLYIKGRYLKLSRNCPQSPWFLNNQKVLPWSVWEIIQARVPGLIPCDGTQIHGSGREDFDVRMLGAGR
eukprot:CAMPEP_0194713044 /NCGR_PEP_ID=MMETSP0296-20130528/5000_1 /TAXON_ID=39354 /ORGANISM="Heterosigma akashiwo, Strain CCMP2393" /LENGTH=340 /DNA_ID=CAMNT_0039611679 /DNA_START=146 /DNA_END=1164 /DNA_ORIENTATION=-